MTVVYVQDYYYHLFYVICFYKHVFYLLPLSHKSRETSRNYKVDISCQYKEKQLRSRGFFCFTSINIFTFRFDTTANSGIISCNYTSLASITFLLIKRIFSPCPTLSLFTYFSLSGPGPGLCDGHHRGDGQAVQDVEHLGGGHQQAACRQHSGNYRGGVSQVGPGHFCYISLFHFY